jgi:pimeloyl-ACP methyl ester carboxylesterase
MIGLWDRNCGVDIARDLAERLPQGQLHLFTRSAHLPHDEEPAEYVQAIHPFLYCP